MEFSHSCGLGGSVTLWLRDDGRQTGTTVVQIRWLKDGRSGSRDRRDELQRRIESLRQMNHGEFEAYTTEEDCSGKLLVGVQWLAIVMEKKPPSLITKLQSKVRRPTEEMNPVKPATETKGNSVLKNINSLIRLKTKEWQRRFGLLLSRWRNDGESKKKPFAYWFLRHIENFLGLRRRRLGLLLRHCCLSNCRSNSVSF